MSGAGLIENAQSVHMKTNGLSLVAPTWGNLCLGWSGTALGCNHVKQLSESLVFPLARGYRVDIMTSICCGSTQF